MPVEQSQVYWSWDVRRAVKKEHIGTHRNSVRTSKPGVFTEEATGQDSGRRGQSMSKQMGMDIVAPKYAEPNGEDRRCLVRYLKKRRFFIIPLRPRFCGSQAELLPVQGLKNWLCFLARIVTLPY